MGSQMVVITDGDMPKAERMAKELVAAAPAGSLIDVHAPAGRQILTWIGGSRLVQSSDFTSLWITSDDYDAEGPEIVDTRCPW